MSRRESRESAFKLLYQMEIQKQDFEKQKAQFISDYNVKENELDYFNLLIAGVSDNKSQIDNVYSQHLKKWNLDRIAKIDQTILRIATFEILFVPMVPFNVSVSEAVFLSKKYSTDEARSFINGILGNLSHLKPQDSFDVDHKKLLELEKEEILELEIQKEKQEESREELILANQIKNKIIKKDILENNENIKQIILDKKKISKPINNENNKILSIDNKEINIPVRRVAKKTIQAETEKSKNSES